MFQNLDRIDCGCHRWEFVGIVDNKKISVIELRKRLEGYGFRNIELVGTGRRRPSATDFDGRRNRIAEGHNQARELVGGSDFVFTFEDDTEIPKNAHNKLLRSYRSRPEKTGLIQGAQVSRHGPPFIGAWTADDLGNPQKYTTLKGKGLEPLDGGGLYCLLVPTKLYKEHEFDWKPPVGPDVHFGLALRKKGYQNFIDWKVKCGHLINGEMRYPDAKSVKLEYYVDKNNRWQYKEI